MAALHACRMTSRSFIAQGHDFLRAAVWAAGALDRSGHVPAALRTRKSFYPRGNVCPRATVYAPAPAGAGAPSGATGSGCAPFSPPARRFLPAWRLPAAWPPSVRHDLCAGTGRGRGSFRRGRFRLRVILCRSDVLRLRVGFCLRGGFRRHSRHPCAVRLLFTVPAAVR